MNWFFLVLLALMVLLVGWILERSASPTTIQPAPPRPIAPVPAVAPPRLNDDEVWVIPGVRTAEEFFRAVPALLPDTTIVYLEGSPVPDVVAFLRGHAEGRSYGAPVGTIWSWPRNERYALTSSPQLYAGLADVGSRHADPEICSHIHFYSMAEPLAHWFDAFDDPFLVAKSVPFARIERFCAALGVHCANPKSA